MKHPSTPPDDSNDWESDAVWGLLKQAPAPAASARFADETVRFSRLSELPRPWWQRLLAPTPLAGFAAATAAIAIAVISFSGTAQKQATQVATASNSIEEIAETEMLLAAVDHLDEFSDKELASLIGF
jgi:hypothetical protein